MLALLASGLDPNAPPPGVDPYAWIAYAGVGAMFLALMAIYWYTVREARKREERLVAENARLTDDCKDLTIRATAAAVETATAVARAGRAMEDVVSMQRDVVNALQRAEKDRT